MSHKLGLYLEQYFDFSLNRVKGSWRSFVLTSNFWNFLSESCFGTICDSLTTNRCLDHCSEGKQSVKWFKFRISTTSSLLPSSFWQCIFFYIMITQCSVSSHTHTNIDTCIHPVHQKYTNRKRRQKNRTANTGQQAVCGEHQKNCTICV